MLFKWSCRNGLVCDAHEMVAIGNYVWIWLLVFPMCWTMLSYGVLNWSIVHLTIFGLIISLPWTMFLPGGLPCCCPTHNDQFRSGDVIGFSYDLWKSPILLDLTLADVPLIAISNTMTYGPSIPGCFVIPMSLCSMDAWLKILYRLVD